MQVLIIPKTNLTPEIILDPVNFLFEINGESRPENVNKFFDPVVKWLDEFAFQIIDKKNKDANYNCCFTFVFKLEYFNSSSIKFVYDILKKLEEINESTKCIEIDWYYDSSDDDMHENGVEFSKIINIPFSIVKK